MPEAPTDGANYARKNTAWNNIDALLGASVTGTPGVPQGRLTIQSGVPRMVTSQSGNVVYYTPDAGRYVPLYDGTSLSMQDVLGELSQSLTDATKSPAAAVANKIYDVFVWKDGATFRATRGPAWLSDTGRGTGASTSELLRVRGLYLNAQNITNGPAAQRGTLVGSIRTSGAANVDWIMAALGPGGNAGSYGISNAYNQRVVQAMVTSNSAAYNYIGGWRVAGGSSTNYVALLRGLDDNDVAADYYVTGYTDSGSVGNLGVSVDNTTGINAGSGNVQIGQFYSGAGGTQTALGASASWRGSPGLGWHTFYPMESASGSSVVFSPNTGGSTPLALSSFRVAFFA